MAVASAYPEADKFYRATRQTQSPLFRLPRELRNQIYEYYVYEEEGYHHDAQTNKLRRSENLPILNELMYTCTAVAEEMRGIALKTNTIYFYPADFKSKGSCSIPSLALRYMRLLDYAQITKWRILASAARCVTPDILAKVEQRYPQTAFTKSFHAFMAHNFTEGVACNDYHWHLKHSYRTTEALNYTLELAAEHPSFKGLASAVVHRSLYAERQLWYIKNCFLQGAQHWLLDWMPAAWAIPDEQELENLEALIEPHHKYTFYSENDPQLFPWFFSATAVGIRFLHKVGRVRRMQIRQIILVEGEKAVSSPEVHARGLVPFQIENPRLRIQRRVDLWSHIIPSRWGDTIHHDWWNMRKMQSDCILDPVSTWITEAASVSIVGTPAHSFSLVLQAKEADHVWRMLKEAAALQDAFLEFRRHRDLVPSPALDPMYESRHWPLPSFALDGFPQVFKDIVVGRSVVRIEYTLGEPWNSKDMVQRRSEWSLTQWRREWEKNFVFAQMKTPDGGIGAYCGGYPSRA